MYVIGTAGHVDHGKSTLVKALTDIDPDRLPEEKEREMTVDLGFAWMTLPSGREVSIVDVPGHERFIKNMLAGVGGIDLALLIVAADESVMPQTREHLAILDILRVTRGLVVVTKTDLVDEELVELVKAEVEDTLAGTSFEGCPMVGVSAYTGDGLDELRGMIDGILDDTESRRDLGRPRLPIDRCFTISGFGTVVTGTLIDGSLAVGQEIELAGSQQRARIRGLQSHKTRVTSAEPGVRLAVNLSGISRDDIERGEILTSPRLAAPGDKGGRPPANGERRAPLPEAQRRRHLPPVHQRIPGPRPSAGRRAIDPGGRGLGATAAVRASADGQGRLFRRPLRRQHPGRRAGGGPQPPPPPSPLRRRSRRAPDAAGRRSQRRCNCKRGRSSGGRAAWQSFPAAPTCPAGKRWSERRSWPKRATWRPWATWRPTPTRWSTPPSAGVRSRAV